MLESENCFISKEMDAFTIKYSNTALLIIVLWFNSDISLFVQFLQTHERWYISLWQETNTLDGALDFLTTLINNLHLGILYRNLFN